jgi:hypothetical protein
MPSINSYDGNLGRYGSIASNPMNIRGRDRNQTMPISIPLNDTHEDEFKDEIEDTELDKFVNRLRKKTDSEKVHVVDLGRSKAKGQNFVTNVGGYLTMEDATSHTNPIMKGMTPRLTYPKNNTKGTAFGVRANSLPITNKPARRTGTLRGWSKAPKPKNNEKISNIWSLKDIDPYNNAMIRQNKIRKFINSLG